MARKNDAWDNDAIQFPRLLAEIWAAGLSADQYTALEESMGIPRKRIYELFERAEAEFEHTKQRTADLPKHKKLWKTTAVIWSEFDPSACELDTMATEASNGQAYCSQQKVALVKNPSLDPDWDGTEFFDGCDK